MTLDEIKELVQLVKDSGVAEIEVQRGENRVWIKSALGNSVPPVVAPPRAHAAAPPAPAPSPAAGESGPHGMPDAGTALDPSLTLVKSPIVGTFYEAPSPGAPPFVKVGDTVQPGQVLCIIESMKLMNEIEAEMAGVVVTKLVENGRPVEYGEALFAIRPL